jgi:hypothetical protein
VKRLNDLQLALVVARLWEGEEGRIYRNTLEEHALSHAVQSGDRALQSLVLWLLRRYRDAVHVLAFKIPPTTTYTSTIDSTGPSIPSKTLQHIDNPTTFNPGLLHFFRFLSKHHKVINLNDDISTLEEILVRHTVYAYHHAGCNRLALQTLATATKASLSLAPSDIYPSQLLKVFIDRNLILNCALHLLAQVEMILCHYSTGGYVLFS